MMPFFHFAEDAFSHGGQLSVDELFAHSAVVGVSVEDDDHRGNEKQEPGDKKIQFFSNGKHIHSLRDDRYLSGYASMLLKAAGKKRKRT